MSDMQNYIYDEKIEETETEDFDNENGDLTLEEFLAQNSVEGLTDEIVLNERLKNFRFKIGSMTRKELESYQKLCIIRNGQGKIIRQDSMKFSELVVVNHCLYPNFKSVEFLQKLGVNTPSEALQKTLKTGEITNLSERIMKFNGFEDFEDTREKAKN